MTHHSEPSRTVVPNLFDTLDWLGGMGSVCRGQGTPMLACMCKWVGVLTWGACTLMHMREGVGCLCAFTKGGGAHGSFAHLHTCAKGLWGHACRGAEDLCLWPGPVTAMDLHRAADRGLGTHDLDGYCEPL